MKRGQKKPAAKGRAARKPKRKPAEVSAPVVAASIKTKVELRRRYGVSQNTVEKWAARPDFPGGRRGPWDPGQVDAFLQVIESPAAPGGSAAGDVVEGGAGPGLVLRRRKLSRMQKRTLVAKVQKLEEELRGVKLRNDIAAGKLVDPEKLLQQVAAIMLRIKLRIQAIPEEVRMELPPDARVDVVKRLKSLFDNVLREMARFKPNVE